LVPAPEISAPAATTPPFSAGVPEPSRGVRRERREVNRSPVALDGALAVGDDAHPAREPLQLAGLQDEGRVAGMAGGELRRRERLEEEEAARHERLDETRDERPIEVERVHDDRVAPPGKRPALEVGAHDVHAEPLGQRGGPQITTAAEGPVGRFDGPAEPCERERVTPRATGDVECTTGRREREMLHDERRRRRDIVAIHGARPTV